MNARKKRRNRINGFWYMQSIYEKQADNAAAFADKYCTVITGTKPLTKEELKSILNK